MDVPDEFMTRRSALDLGLTDTRIHAATHSGALVRIRHGALADPAKWAALDRDEQQRLRVRAAAARSIAECAVSHDSAATLLRLPLLDPTWRTIHFTALDDRDGHRSRVRTRHRGPLDARDLAEVEGVVVTSLARTALDVAREGSFAQAVCAIESALRAGVERDDLEETLARMGRRTGNAMARGALSFADPRPESVGESWSRVLMHGWRDIPTPRLQREFHTRTGEFVARTDFDWDRKLVGEFDGTVKYREDASEVVVAEKRREDSLRALGVHVVRWTWSDLVSPWRLHEILRAGFRIASGVRNV
ncbi:hypothetical protein [Aldersonia kunmingensis]|uniref:hypothetical protein n=1 Tax=Aldersonia kunmingensis TaxID=408066 RepID=UPI00082DFA03|nr:hypothetical protein [Aldersonia kunmingensis]